MLNEVQLARTDLNLLVIFDAVNRERHVGRAAARLNPTPSAVSHGLGRLRILLSDPLFLKLPKGVVPIARAEGLAQPLADILTRARNIIATAEPFNPATSGRRFIIGALYGISAVILPPTLASYCNMLRVVVSLGDDANTLVDRALERKRLSRRVVL
jgi:DNA-binding transcriptional LysR family regulator